MTFNNPCRDVPNQPIGIVEQTFLPQVDGSFVYSFESDNGIKQQASGERKPVGEDGSDVIVMKGSYEFIGADGQVYVVDWEADENGFRPSAPHLPQSVPIPFPEQQAAVDAQIRFAAEEDELARQGKSARLETPVLARQNVKRPALAAQPQVVFEDY